MLTSPARCLTHNQTELLFLVQKEYIELEPTFYAPTEMRLFTKNGEIIHYKNEYKGHGLREQAIEMEHCVKNNLIESSKMPHHDTLEVIKIMDEVRAKIGLTFK